MMVVFDDISVLFWLLIRLQSFGFLFQALRFRLDESPGEPRSRMWFRRREGLEHRDRLMITEVFLFARWFPLRDIGLHMVYVVVVYVVVWLVSSMGLFGFCSTPGRRQASSSVTRPLFSAGRHG